MTFEHRVEDTLRALALYVSSGGYNDTFDLDIFDAKIRKGIDYIYELNNNLIKENTKLKEEIRQLKIQKYNLILEILVAPDANGICPIELIIEENPIITEKLKKLL